MPFLRCHARPGREVLRDLRHEIRGAPARSPGTPGKARRTGLPCLRLAYDPGDAVLRDLRRPRSGAAGDPGAAAGMPAPAGTGSTGIRPAGPDRSGTGTCGSPVRNRLPGMWQPDSSGRQVLQ